MCCVIIIFFNLISLNQELQCMFIIYDSKIAKRTYNALCNYCTGAPPLPPPPKTKKRF